MDSDEDESALPKRHHRSFYETPNNLDNDPDNNREGSDAENVVSNARTNNGWDTTTPSPKSVIPGSRAKSAERTVPRQGSFDRSASHPTPSTRSRSPSFARYKIHPSTHKDLVVATTPRKSASYNDIAGLDGYEPLTGEDGGQMSQAVRGDTHQRRSSVDDGERTDSPVVQWSESMVVRAYLRHSRQSSRNEAVPLPSPTGGPGSANEEKNDIPGGTQNEREILNTVNIQARQSNYDAPSPANPSRVSRNTGSVTSKQRSARQSRSSKRGRRYLSTNRRLSGSFYFHDDFLDENLLISATKLDSTLLRLFSHTRKVTKNAEGTDDDDPRAKLMPFLNYSQSDLISMDPVMWRVYPMDSVQRETLDQEMTFIEENVQPRDILSKLYQDEVLTLMDYNQITRTEGQGNKAVTRLLIKTVQRRGEKAYPALLNALQSNDYKHVCARLSDTERVLREGMIEDKKERIRPTWTNINTTTPHQVRMPSRSNENALFSTILTSPTNKLASPFNSGEPTNQMAPRTDHAASPNHWSVSGHATNSDGQEVNTGQDIDSEQLEKYLRDLKAELEALHDDVTALKSARSLSLPADGGSSSRNERESVDPRPELLAREPAEPETDDVHTLQNQLPASRDQKSSTCTLL